MKKLVRVQFDMTAERVADLDRLMEMTEVNNRRDFFNNALTLFEWAVFESRLGRRIASVSVDEEEGSYKIDEVIKLPALSAASSLSTPSSRKRKAS